MGFEIRCCDQFGWGSRANNHHNLPLERFPEFQTIITKVRKMVGLTPIYGTPSQEHHMDSMVQQHNNRRTGSSSGR